MKASPSGWNRVYVEALLSVPTGRERFLPGERVSFASPFLCPGTYQARISKMDPHYAPYPNILPIIFRIGPVQLQWYGLMYLLAFVAAPIGLGLGRIGNFINGELFGRPSDLPWPWYFLPEDPRLVILPSSMKPFLKAWCYSQSS